MKPAVVFPDSERLTVDLLSDLLASHHDAEVGISLPSTFSSGEFVQVAWDGTPVLDHPVAAHATVRVIAWAHSTTEAKSLAALCMGLLLAHDGTGGISAIRPLTGVLPAHDDDNRADLASFTVRVSTRSVPL